MKHVSVLFQTVMEWLQPTSGARYIDGTLGFGGHTAGILERSVPDGLVLAFDRDEQAITAAQERLGPQRARVTFMHSSFARMAEVAPMHGFGSVAGIVLDLGLSSMQLDDPQRGFSFRFDAPLDMRFDQSRGATAAEFVNNLTETELADLFWRYGEERRSRQLARVIVANRPIVTTRQLADLIAAHTPRRRQQKMRIHPATQIFQALRIAVNDELGALEQGVPAAIELLQSGGRLVVISFHSLEDRYIKRLFRELSRECVCPPQQPICTCNQVPVIRLPQRKAIQSSPDEIADNPRSRSARLRIAEKL
jgi:16S rRNA (cytosine1402-N4)-methyltransferase